MHVARDHRSCRDLLQTTAAEKPRLQSNSNQRLHLHPATIPTASDRIRKDQTAPIRMTENGSHRRQELAPLQTRSLPATDNQRSTTWHRQCLQRRGDATSVVHLMCGMPRCVVRLNPRRWHRGPHRSNRLLGAVAFAGLRQVAVPVAKIRAFRSTSFRMSMEDMRSGILPPNRRSRIQCLFPHLPGVVEGSRGKGRLVVGNSFFTNSIR